jgi:glycosyltransferase involved in cell wall biosynthesis
VTPRLLRTQFLNPMHLIHVVDRLDPSDGGPPAVVARLAAAQALEGHDVTIAAHTPACTAAELSSAYDRIPGFRAVRQTFFEQNSLFERLSAAAALRSMPVRFGGADFVHLHGIWRPVLLRTAQYCYGAGLPYAITPHGMLKRWAMSQNRAKKTLGMSFGWRRALSQATFLHYLNSNERDEASELGLTTRTFIRPNGVSIAEMSALEFADPAFAAALPERYLLFLGRLHYSKGLDVLCEAFGRLAATHADLHLMIAGPDFGYEHRLRELIAQTAHGTRVHRIGSVFGANKLHLLRHALCLCQPTRQEGFSVVILEALASALPVVTTTQAHFPELQAAGAGFITELVPDAIAAAINTLILDANLRVRMGIAGRQLVTERYDWSAIARNMIETYEDAIESPAARAIS